MEKIKYYQLTFKNGECRKLISPSRTEIASLLVDGWELHGFNNEADIPVNPILDNGTVREMTTAEIEAAEQAKKLARTKFSQDEIETAFEALGKKSDLDALIAGNEKFSIYWDLADEIDLEHPLTIQALSDFTAAEINALKLAIP